MKKRTFHIGDILDLLFYRANGGREIFWECDVVEGVDGLILYMLGLDGDVLASEDYFEDYHRFGLALDACIASLRCQFERLVDNQELRRGMRQLKKRLEGAFPDGELESNFLARQAEIFGRYHEVASISHLFIPPAQERFDIVRSFELFTDRPMNLN
ncbi:MAG: hypothetical protein HGA38_00815 [Candidatus Moranbacteria bacterium]|nr:hypothetical protein [Candidatus Moranbacteria bacterium]